ncbi:MAG: tyrosine-type recombinase/integrase [Leifsonia sp.]
MNEQLRASAADHLRLRIARGYQPGDHAWLLRDFLDFLDREDLTTIKTTNALTWACLPKDAGPRWRSQRLAVVRVFAAHVHASDPDLAELIPAGLLPARVVRPTPYLYSVEQVAALIDQARTLRPELRGHTLGAIIGLMAATGMRTAEALALDTEHVDSAQATILVRGKGGTRRLLPVHPSTIMALAHYRSTARQLLMAAPRDNSFFLSQAGTRPVANTVQRSFREVATGCDLPLEPGNGKPRLYDLRHSFAVSTLIDAHRSGDGVDARVAALATYLGHRSPIHTYWYLSASPELLHLVSDRVEQHVQEGRP